MLIVCPNCATSYMVDQGALGPEGRTVRCARCRRTWFATADEQPLAVDVFAGEVSAEAEAQTTPTSAPAVHAPDEATLPALYAEAGDDFGAEADEPIAEKTIEPSDDNFKLAAPEEPAPEPHFEAPSLVPPIEHEPLPEAETAAAESDSDDVESYAARRQRMQMRRKQSRRSSRWIALVLVLLAINVAVIGGREEVVRYLPQTASLFEAIGLPVNLRHLRFENVKITRELQEGVDVLIVDGDIISVADKPIAVPRLRFAARDSAGQEIYTWTALPERSILNPGEKLPFRSRLASPPAQAKTVMVRFYTAQDAAGGTK